MAAAHFSRNIINTLSRASLLTRCYSNKSPSSLVDIKLNEQHGYAVMTMQKAPVNSLNTEMLDSITDSLKQLEKDKCNGVLLTSAFPGVFCAGLDIREMYQSTEEKLRIFWNSLQNFWLQMYGSKMTTIALINRRFLCTIMVCYYLLNLVGHALAGGCVVALNCDSRIMVNGKFKIGVNEAKLGLVVPFWVKDTLVNTMSIRATERALQLATLFSAEEALKVGLVDSIVPDIEAGYAAAESEMQQFFQTPLMTRYGNKMRIREEALKNLVNNREADFQFIYNLVSSEPIQAEFGRYLKKMENKN